MKEEASGMAIATSEFINKAHFLQLATGIIDNKIQKEFFVPLKKIFNTGRPLRLFAFVPERKDIVFDLGPYSSYKIPEHLPADLPWKLQENGTVIDYVEGTESSSSIMRCFAPISDSQGNIIGILGVETSAVALAEQKQQCFVSVIIGVFVCTVAGCICAFTISFILQANIKSLKQASDLVGSGQYDKKMKLRRSVVHEFNDLWNTFHTMISILKGVIAKTKMEILSMELFRTDEDLIRTFDNNFWQPRQLIRNNMTFLIMKVNNGHPESFMELVETDGHVYSLFGQIFSLGDDFKSARMTSAIASYMKQYLLRDGLNNTLHTVIPLFPLKELKVIDWDELSSKSHIQEYDSSKNEFYSYSIEVRNGFRKAFHDLGNEAEKRFDLYIKTYRNCPSQKLLGELLQLISSIDPIPRGVLALISKE